MRVWGPARGWAPREGAPSHTHPSSCWSSPRHTGRRALPPSCSSRRCSFLATKLNLWRDEAGTGPALEAEGTAQLLFLGSLAVTAAP